MPAESHHFCSVRVCARARPRKVEKTVERAPIWSQRPQREPWLCHFQAVRVSVASCFDSHVSHSSSTSGLCSGVYVWFPQRCEGSGAVAIGHMMRQGPKATKGRGQGQKASKQTDETPSTGQLALTLCSPRAPVSLSLLIDKTMELEPLPFQLSHFRT